LKILGLLFIVWVAWGLIEGKESEKDDDNSEHISSSDDDQDDQYA
jgi:threonine/homoserine/homoserine lactone efflux protein